MCRNKPKDLATFEGNIKPCFDLMTILIGNSNYVINPFVRCKFAEAMMNLTPYEGGRITKDILDSILIDNKLTETSLMPEIIKLYIDMEHSGTSHQFHDRLTPRYHMALFLKYIWNNEKYRKVFIQTSKYNYYLIFRNDETLKFYNYMLNDSIYLLDETFKILTEIKQSQDDYNNKSVWNNFSKEEQEKRSEIYRQNEGKIVTYCLLSRETVHMFNFISKDAPEPFMRKEMITRVTSMLNYYLVELTGSKCQNLKVQNQEKYYFDPKYLLSEIIDIYCNFKKFEDFYDSIAKDERSYNHEIFLKALQILKKIQTRNNNRIKEFESVVEKSKEIKDRMKEEDNFDDVEIPDEFIDRLTYEIMSDPVKMPGGMSIGTLNIYILDRASIERHLLNEQNDPFTKKFLTKDMLVDDVELKEKIENWKIKIRKEKKEKEN
jgi:ubiquitin conjugation factor E4 B